MKRERRRRERRRVITSNHQKWDGGECKTNKTNNVTTLQLNNEGDGNEEGL